MSLYDIGRQLYSSKDGFGRTRLVSMSIFEQTQSRVSFRSISPSRSSSIALLQISWAKRPGEKVSANRRRNGARFMTDLSGSAEQSRPSPGQRILPPITGGKMDVAPP